MRYPPRVMMIAGMTALDIPLRDARDYVHSTDLFAALGRLAEARLSPDAWLRKLALRGAAFHQVEAHFSPHDYAFGTFEFEDQGRTTAGWLVESKRDIGCRISFDEAPVCDAATLLPGRISLSAPVGGYTSFEQAIVLFKLLCMQFRVGEWRFTAIDLASRFREDLPLELVLQQTILGRSVIAELRQNQQSIGRVQMVVSNFAGDTR
jgi:hypothetical protein